MVFFFTCSDPSYVVYMGKDKFENEQLIKYGFPEDIWFHVDKLSSAHVYLRLPPGSVDLFGVKDKAEAKKRLMDVIETVPGNILQEMAVLTKANSIDGCKSAEVDIVYTPFLNLKKEERMDTGQVGFKDEAVRIILKKVARDKDIEKRLEKTRVERNIDFEKDKEERDFQERARRKKLVEDEKRKKKDEEEAKQRDKELKEKEIQEAIENAASKGAVIKTGSVEECRRDDDDDDFM